MLPGMPPGPIEHRTDGLAGHMEHKEPEARPLESIESHHLDLGEGEGHHGEGCEAGHEHGCGLFLTGEYLLVHPRRNALDFAIASPNLTEAPGGRIVSLDWETESGFRTGLGWQAAHEPWQFSATYTYLHTRDNTFLASPLNGTLYATLTRGGGIDDVSTAAASTNLTTTSSTSTRPGSSALGRTSTSRCLVAGVLPGSIRS